MPACLRSRQKGSGFCKVVKTGGCLHGFSMFSVFIHYETVFKCLNALLWIGSDQVKTAVGHDHEHLKLPLVYCGQSLPGKCEKWCIRSRSGLARKHVSILCCYWLNLIVGKALLTDIEWTFLSLQEYFALHHGFVQFYHNRRLIALLTLYLSYNWYWYCAI